jgi:hypothetical protein
MKNMLRPRLADVPALSVAGNLPFQLAGDSCGVLNLVLYETMD